MDRTGGELVNVETAEIESKVDIAIKGDRVALVGDAKHCIGAGTRVIDAREVRVTGPARCARAHEVAFHAYGLPAARRDP